MASAPLVRAAASPFGLGAGAVAVLVGLLAGAPVVGVALGVVLWAAVAVLVLLRRSASGPGSAAGVGRRDTRGIDPFALGEPWRFFVRDALQARARFREVVGRAPAGPIRARLDDIGRRLDEGVGQVWATAQQGDTLRQARRRIDVAALTRRLDDARSAAAAETAADPLGTEDIATRTVASLQSQLESAARMDEVTQRTEQRLTLLQAQLDESVTRAAELAASSADVSALTSVGTDIDHRVEEMEALRLALEETGRLQPGTG